MPFHIETKVLKCVINPISGVVYIRGVSISRIEILKSLNKMGILNLAYCCYYIIDDTSKGRGHTFLVKAFSPRSKRFRSPSYPGNFVTKSREFFRNSRLSFYQRMSTMSIENFNILKVLKCS